MKIEPINVQNQLPTGPQNNLAEKVAQEKPAPQASRVDEAEKKEKVAPEEVLDRIKALTDGGTYSVRFEADKETEEMIVKIVDPKNGETIRQIPPEEILGVNKKLQDLRAVILDTKG